ncbi:MAG: tetratricopeptide repeat protein [Bacteroidales bacterium]|nr:tetratricopeptide repeat protein [Bacteroidales bacterium]
MIVRKYILAALLAVLCLSASAQSRRDIAALDSLTAVSESSAMRSLVLRKATLLRRMYCFDEAAEALSSLLRPGAMDLEVLGELADCHFQASRFDEARQLYFILSQQRPEDLGYQIRYMYLLGRAKAYSSVIAQGRELLKRDTLLQALTLVGDAFNNMEQPDSAMHYYNAALLRRPRNASVVSKMSNILLGRKDYDGVLSLSDNYLAMDSLNVDILRIKGLAHYLKGEYEPSAASFETVIGEGDDSYAPHYYLAKDLYHQHLHKEADEHFMKAWQLDSTRASLAMEIADNRTNGPYRYESEVKPWFEKALVMMEPDHDLLASIYQTYATAEYARQNWDLAISLYKVAFEFNPKLISALSTIGYCYEQKKDYRNAVEYYERYLEYGKPGSNAYKFVEESLRFIRAELFMEERQ